MPTHLEKLSIMPTHTEKHIMPVHKGNPTMSTYKEKLSIMPTHKEKITACTTMH